MSRPTSPFAANIPRLCVIRLLFWMHFMSAVIVPFFRDWGGIELSTILFLNGWFMAWNFLLEVPTGTIADRFSRKTSIVLGLALGAVAMAIYVSAPRLEVFLLAEVVAAWVPGLAFVGLGFLGSPWAVVPLVTLVAGFGLARATLFAAALNRHIPSESRATVLSTISMLRTLAIVVGNGLGGLAVGLSLHGTALAAGLVILLFSTVARTREEHLIQRFS